MIKRCSFCNLNNERYIDYHDNEWGICVYDDNKLFELLLLESFQAGLSWECILNKRDAFERAFDNYDYNLIENYDDVKIDELMNDKSIVRNRRKIMAAINNSKVFKKIQKEYGSFSNYIWGFTGGEVIYEFHKVTSMLSDMVSLDLKKRGMKFVGSTIVYSYLQAIGIINSHEEGCFKYKV